jgi:acetyl-CoA carboxylase biotin carboxyl carrier protein
MGMDEIEQLVRLVAGAKISELTVQRDGRRITIRKSAALSAQRSQNEPVQASVESPVQTTDGPESNAQNAPLEILSPMVGIFRPARTPIRAGDSIREGQVVGMIESMKLMNDIRSEQSGVVTEVLAEDGMPVEYGQPLFKMSLGG